MNRKSAVDQQLSRSLGLTINELEPLLAVGGDAAEKQFMECCWCLWKADGIDLVGSSLRTAGYFGVSCSL
mgnify:CR=1 FL=1